MASHAPQLRAGSDRCPWCGVFVSFFCYHSAVVEHRRKTRAGGDFEDRPGGVSGPFQWRVFTQYCPACGRPHVCVEQVIREGAELRTDVSTVYPLAHGRPPVPPEVPTEFRVDYEEACAVLPISPQSSAALARRLLQALLRGPGQVSISSKNLYDEVNASQGALPAFLWEQLHILRTVGNFAAHPIKDSVSGAIQPVEPGEAEFSLSVIEALFEHYFVAPARISEAKRALNAKLAAANKAPLP